MFEEFIKNTQKLLIEDIKNFKATMDASLEMMCLTEKGLAIYCNTSWTHFTGRPLEQELGNGRFDRIHPEDVTATTEMIRTAFSTEVPYRIKYRLRFKNGDYKWVVEDGIPIFSSTNKLLVYVSKCINIDNETKLEIKLHATELKYRRLFEAAHDGILILDSSTGEITDVNPFLKILLGYSKEEFIGKKLWEVGAFKNIEASKDTFKILQETGYVRYDDLPLETKDGRLIPVEFVSNLYIVGDNTVIQCNIRDISVRKKMEEVEKTMLSLKQEQQKNIFIADVTHELRTPLAIIKGNVELALKDTSTPKEETLEAINEEVNHLSKMLSDLAMLTTNKKDLQKKILTQRVDLSKIVKQVVNRLMVISSQKNISIQQELAATLPILGDKDYLEKLISNIVSNAMYYGKKNGSITIRGAISNTKVVLIIEDDGIGISPEDLPNIFERFYRSEEAREVNHEGTGLGLAISKWIVELHQGTISVVSSSGKGTTFTIEFSVCK